MFESLSQPPQPATMNMPASVSLEGGPTLLGSALWAALTITGLTVTLGLLWG